MMSDTQWIPIFSEFLNSSDVDPLLCPNFTHPDDYDHDGHVEDWENWEDGEDEDGGGRPHQTSSSSFVRYHFVMNVYVVIALCCLGFIGNIASVIVLRTDQRRTSSSSSSSSSADRNATVTTTNWLLQMLAAVDILFLISCLLIYSIRTINHPSRSTSSSSFNVMPLIDPYLPGVASIAHMLTIYTVLLVTLDRFIAVCRPMSRQLRSIRRARLTFVSVVIFSVAFSLPVFFEQRTTVVTTIDPCTDNRWSHTKTVRTRMRRSALYFILYKTICHAIFRSLGPLIAIIVLNGRLISSLRRLNRRHRPRRPANRDNLTTIIVTVVSIFLFCQLPDVALRIILSIEQILPSSAAAAASSEWFQLSAFFVKVLSHVLLTMNSCVNFLIYCLTGRRFRRIFLQLFLRRRPSATSLPVPTTVVSELLPVQPSFSSVRLKPSLHPPTINVEEAGTTEEVTEL